MDYEVRLTQGAEQDLEDIYDYLAQSDPEYADSLLDGLMEMVESLSTFPARGSYPKELLATGIHEYRQVILKGFRLIYRIHGSQIVVYLIADGRRDFQSLLQRRLLR